MRSAALTLMVACCALLPGEWLFAQGDFSATAIPHQVFVERDVDGSGIDRLLFQNVITDSRITVPVNGERYTLLGDGVLYVDSTTRLVMLASSDGQLQLHPFIQPQALTRRVDWAVSGSGKLIAWTLTNGTSPSDLTTVTTVANFDGTNARRVLVDGPREGIRALPVAFDAEQSTLYMDFQPDLLGGFTPLRQYAGMFTLDLESGETAPLPGEPGCFCGGGLGGGHFVRLALNESLSGFDVRVFDLVNDADWVIPALDLPEFTQAGDLLIAPDGTRAVYALSRVRGFGSPEQTVNTRLVDVDLLNRAQTVLTGAIDGFAQPAGWTDENSAVLFTIAGRNGTWKAAIGAQAVTQIAQATYLGAFHATALPANFRDR